MTPAPLIWSCVVTCGREEKHCWKITLKITQHKLPWSCSGLPAVIWTEALHQLLTHSRRPTTKSLKQDHKLRLQGVITAWKGAFCRAAHWISSNSCNLPLPPAVPCHCIPALRAKIDNMWNHRKDWCIWSLLPGKYAVVHLKKHKLNFLVFWKNKAGPERNL